MALHLRRRGLFPPMTPEQVARRGLGPNLPKSDYERKLAAMTGDELRRECERLNDQCERLLRRARLAVLEGRREVNRRKT